MSPIRYVVPRKGRTTISTDTETRLAVKAYAKAHGLTVVGAHLLIIKWGLRSLMVKEEKAERNYNLTVLKLGRELLEKRKKEKLTNNPKDDN